MWHWRIRGATWQKLGWVFMFTVGNVKQFGQEPRSLYGRDSKFCVSFKSGMEKRWFSVPLLMTRCHQIDLPKSNFKCWVVDFLLHWSPKMHQIAQICTYTFKNFQEWYSKPHNKLHPQTLPSQHMSTVPLFQSFCDRWLGFKIHLWVLRSSADLQLYDSEFQTEGALTMKAFTDNQGPASSIPWHADFHTAPQNSSCAAEFAACHRKMWNCLFLLRLCIIQFWFCWWFSV